MSLREDIRDDDVGYETSKQFKILEENLKTHIGNSKLLSQQSQIIFEAMNEFNKNVPLYRKQKIEDIEAMEKELAEVGPGMGEEGFAKGEAEEILDKNLAIINRYFPTFIKYNQAVSQQSQRIEGAMKMLIAFFRDYLSGEEERNEEDEKLDDEQEKLMGAD